MTDEEVNKKKKVSVQRKEEKKTMKSQNEFKNEKGVKNEIRKGKMKTNEDDIEEKK